MVSPHTNQIRPLTSIEFAPWRIEMFTFTLNSVVGHDFHLFGGSERSGLGPVRVQRLTPRLDLQDLNFMSTA